MPRRGSGTWWIPAGSRSASINLAADKWIMAVTARFVYVLWRDQDDVEWLQAYAR
ncbi:MAG: hypothetical protein IPO52_10385 [Gemmatimonadetes bacterium]|nr:hypothetical protein [Gemmatimonadota bacterium]